MATLQFDLASAARRLEERIAELSRIGGGPARVGVTRLAYSPEERRAHRLVADWMRDAGLIVREDAVGNLFGCLPANCGGAAAADRGFVVDVPAEAPVWTGSHLDTVPMGGRFDGVAGVLAALAAAEHLRETGAPLARPVEVCVFVGEEGSRFRGLLGSRAVVHGLTDEELASTDAEGVSLAEAMRAAGLDPARARYARVRRGQVRAFLELHVEQGPVLERARRPLGLVTAVAGPLELLAEVRGQADHAGTTPMDARRDSFLAAAELALFAERLARETSSSTVDLRDVDGRRRDRAEAALRREFERILQARGLSGEWRDLLRVAPVPVAPHVLAVLRGAAQEAGVPYVELPSGAAHDAMVMAEVCPFGMLFVRSIGGRSHCPEEESRVGDIALGAHVLAGAIRALAAPAPSGEAAQSGPSVTRAQPGSGPSAGR